MSPAPAITRLSVSTGPFTGGTTVTVTATDLASVNPADPGAVRVGGVPARSFSLGGQPFLIGISTGAGIPSNANVDTYVTGNVQVLRTSAANHTALGGLATLPVSGPALTQLQNIDAFVQKCNAVGIKVILGVAGGDNQSGAGGPGMNSMTDVFGPFVVALAARYMVGSPFGEIYRIEVGNEPNFFRWDAIPNPGEYARLMGIVHAGVKALGAGRPLVMWGGTAGAPTDDPLDTQDGNGGMGCRTWTRGMYAWWNSHGYGGAVEYPYDVASTHRYTYPNIPSVFMAEGHMRGWGASTVGTSSDHGVQRIREDNNDGDKPHGCNEFGVPYPFNNMPIGQWKLIMDDALQLFGNEPNPDCFTYFTDFEKRDLATASPADIAEHSNWYGIWLVDEVTPKQHPPETGPTIFNWYKALAAPATQLTLVTPPGVPGAAHVTVTNAFGTSTPSTDDEFLFTSAVPIVNMVSVSRSDGTVFTNFAAPLTVDGLVSFAWTAVDDLGVVDSWLEDADGNVLAPGVAGVAWSGDYDLTPLPDGTVQVRAVAVDGEGQRGESQLVTLDVQHASAPSGAIGLIARLIYTNFTSAPIVTIAEATPNPFTDIGVELTLSFVSDQPGNYVVSIANATVASGTCTAGTTTLTLPLTAFTPGQNDVLVTVTNPEGSGSDVVTITRRVFAVGPLANDGDLEARLGRPFNDRELARAIALLRDASATVRGYTGGQTISRAKTTQRFVPKRYDDCTWGIILPQWPVVSIGAVVDDAGAPVGITWLTEEFGAVSVPVTVTYTHGYDPVPDDVIAVVCQLAGRAFGTKPEDAGVTSETLGGYTYGVGAAAAAGPLGMLDDEKRAMRKYQRPTRPISMLGAPTRRIVDSWA